MSLIPKPDRSSWCQAQAEKAKQRALSSAGQPIEQTWLQIAQSWETLAQLHYATSDGNEIARGQWRNASVWPD